MERKAGFEKNQRVLGDKKKDFLVAQKYQQLRLFQPLAPLRPSCCPHSPVSSFHGLYMAP